MPIFFYRDDSYSSLHLKISQFWASEICQYLSCGEVFYSWAQSEVVLIVLFCLTWDDPVFRIKMPFQAKSCNKVIVPSSDDMLGDQMTGEPEREGPYVQRAAGEVEGGGQCGSMLPARENPHRTREALRCTGKILEQCVGVPLCKANLWRSAAGQYPSGCGQSQCETTDIEQMQRNEALMGVHSQHCDLLS